MFLVFETMNVQCMSVCLGWDGGVVYHGRDLDRGVSDARLFPGDSALQFSGS